MKQIISFLIVLMSSLVSAKVFEVKDANGLQNALNSVLPGDVINLADGKYLGKFKTTKSGTATNRITLKGSRNAVLSCGDVGRALTISGDFWTVSGFSVANSKKGIFVESGNKNILTNLYVHHINQEAIHILQNSCDNVVQNSVISHTGLTDPGIGEGVYIGSSKNHWVNNAPDLSHRNKVLNNHFGPHISAESVDIKEGTQNGVVSGNTFDGTGMTGANYGDSWIDLKGQGYEISNNKGTLSLRDGIQVHSLAMSTSGCNNKIINNVCSKLPAGGKCVVIPAGLSCPNEVKNNITN